MTRSFYYISGLIVILFSVMAASPSTDDNSRIKVIIIGAGVAGLSAAKALKVKGHDFVVLEGSGRLCGRIKSQTIGDVTVEVGSQYIKGGGGGADPVWDLAVRADITTHEVDNQGFGVYDETGTDVTAEAVTRYDSFDPAFASLADLANTLETVDIHKPDVSQRKALSMASWTPEDAIDDAIEYFDTDFTYGHSPETASTRHSYIPGLQGQTERLVVDQDGGLQQICTTLAGDVFDSVDDLRRVMNAKVTKIKQTDSGVEVETENGASYSGDYVIATFSLGVLKNEAVTFDPELPSWKKYAIAGSTFVNDFSIYLKFSDSTDAFWDIGDYALFASVRRGYYTVWLNLDNIITDSKVLVVQVSGLEAHRISRLSDDDVKLEVTEVLRTMYGMQNIPEPEEILIPMWGSDPLFYGSYSDWSSDFPASSHDALRAPIDRLYFAGEAYHKEWFGYIQGAYLSGIEETEKLLKCSRNASYCEAFKPLYETRGCIYDKASNYDASARIDDGSCQFPHIVNNNTLTGCTYQKANNYDANAQIDDGSCQFPNTSANLASSSKTQSLGLLICSMLIVLKCSYLA